MSLLNEIREAQTPRIGRPCTVGLAIETMSDVDKADIAAAFADETIAVSAICAALRNRGIDISLDVMRRHRRGACRCGAR